MSLTDLIKLDKHRHSRKLYIKRRSATDGSYESSWVRIDNWEGIDLVIDWGSFSVQIDSDPGIVGSFEVSGLTLVVDNNTGLFNIETFENSIWAPDTLYLNRRYTKVKIEIGYLDESNEIEGETNVFEGYIESVTLSEDGLATIECLSYLGILSRYPISDLSLTGSGSASALLQSILNQSKITEYLGYTVPSLTNNYTIPDASQLDGTYWDVVQEIVFTASSTMTLEGGSFKVVPRVAGSLEWNFKGSGSGDVNDIFSINSYDDEGIGKIRVYWKEDGGSTTAISTDSSLLLKYLSEPELVDLSNVDASDKSAVLTDLLGKWENPIPIIEFDCKLILSLFLLDKITLDVRGKLSPSVSEGGGIWDGFFWDDGTVWGSELGGIIIGAGTEWIVTMIDKQYSTGRMTVRAERV